MRSFLESYERPEQSVAKRREGSWLRHGFKLTVSQYNELLKDQDYKCAICLAPHREDKKLAVDHDHVKGKVRGLLCDYCNRRLLIARNTTQVLERALWYLVMNS